MARRTKEDALATREQILDAAEIVFQRLGVSRASLQEIAQEAGLTRGAIYWHFQNKADVFDAMMRRVTLPMMANFNNQSDAMLKDPLAHLRTSMATAFHQTVHDLRVQRVFEIALHKIEYGVELQVLRDRRIAQRAQHIGDLERVLGQAVACGQLRPDTPLLVAAVGLHSLMDGLMSNWLLSPQTFDLAEVGIRALDAYLVGWSMVSA